MDFKYFTLYEKPPSYMELQVKSWDAKNIFLDFSLLDLYFLCIPLFFIVGAIIPIYFIKKEFYIRAGLSIFLLDIVFWLIISLFSLPYGSYSVDNSSFMSFIVFVTSMINDYIVPFTILLSAFLLLFGLYKLIRQKFFSQKLN